MAFEDPVALERNGWREVTAASLCGPVEDSSVPSSSPSELLLAYPEDLLQSPVDVTRASFSVEAGAPCTSAAADGDVPVDDVAPRGVDRLTSTFTDFLGRTDLTLPFALVSIAAAVLFGVLHAVAPGHGKTVMAAYLVGQRGTRRQALQLGAVVTFTHTASVLLLGLVLSLGALAAPELVVPFTEVLSGVLLVAVGVYLAVLALRRLRSGGDHDHDHPHDRDHDHDHEHPHDHEHRHDHEHDHEHDHQAHQGHDHPHPHPHPHGGGVVVDVKPVAHSHGGRAHTHAPLPDGPLCWKALAGMGVAGGLVPSPSALLVLLGATALGRAWFGVLLVVAYGVGMAVTLTVAGLLLLRARAAARPPRLDARPRRAAGPPAAAGHGRRRRRPGPGPRPARRPHRPRSAVIRSRLRAPVAVPALERSLVPVLPLTRPLRRAACAAVLIAALAGCSSDALDVEGFSAGACTDIAPTLQEVDEALRQVGEEDIEPRAAADRFRAAQDALKPVVESGDAVAEEVQELTRRLGFFRIAADTNNAESQQEDDVRAALDDLAETCRA